MNPFFVVVIYSQLGEIVLAFSVVPAVSRTLIDHARQHRASQPPILLIYHIAGSKQTLPTRTSSIRGCPLRATQPSRAFHRLTITQNCTHNKHSRELPTRTNNTWLSSVFDAMTILWFSVSYIYVTLRKGSHIFRAPLQWSHQTLNGHLYLALQRGNGDLSRGST